MCGIVALVRSSRPPSLDEIVAMRDVVTYRGPDGCGALVDGPVALGHRRLSIIDLAGGQQPMSDVTERYQIVFNGEIYNYLELRQRLSSQGWTFRTNSDTETILAAYALLGDDFVQHLTGMFTFALWDSVDQRLVVARDRLGIKPLYVFRAQDTIAFASEIKSFRPLPEWRGTPRPGALEEYLIYRNLSGRGTMFESVEKVQPGEIWTVDATSSWSGEPRTYWELPHPAHSTGEQRSVDEWSEELDSTMTQVVHDHMISDVPLGTFNSGGVDSSLITALVSEHANDRLNTYSVGFDDPDFDETPYADMVVNRYGTSHHRLVVAPETYAEHLERAIWHHDEPLNHPHSVHLMKLSELAKQKLTVVLTGEGSDELFAGYTRYRFPALLDRAVLRTRLARRSLRLLSALLPQRTRTRIRATVDTTGQVDIAALAAFSDPGAVRALISASVMARDTPEVEAQNGLLAAVLRWDQQTYLQSLLNRMDKMSMAASLEGRVPFLDHRIVELAARMPSNVKLRGATTKYIVKRISERYLPEAIINRKKAGFAVPISQWLRPGGHLNGHLQRLLEPDAKCRDHFDWATVERLCKQHQEGSVDHGEILWGLLNLEIWFRQLATEFSPQQSAVSAAG